MESGCRDSFVLGREVETLVSEQETAGSRSIVFFAIGGSASGGNASGLPSGVYFYRLQVEDPVHGTGSHSATKTLVLLK